MLSFDKSFIVYNFKNISYNTYRFLSLHRNITVNNNINLFSVKNVVISYSSPLMTDFNNISVLGSFLVIRLLSGQFPYISKYNLTSTFSESTHKFIISVSLNKANLNKFLSWFFVQYYNPSTFYNIKVSSKTLNSFSVNLNSYNLIKQMSVHPIFFK